MDDELTRIRTEKPRRLLAALGGKYRYAAAVILLGCMLMLLPRGCGQTASQSQEQTQSAADLDDQALLHETEQQLAALLAQVDGAGRCAVMLSLASGSERLYQTDLRQSSGESQERTTVFYQSGSDRLPVVQETRSPVYRGAVVVCQGADRASVRLKIVEAVSSLTGLGSDKIKVIKMDE